MTQERWSPDSIAGGLILVDSNSILEFGLNQTQPLQNWLVFKPYLSNVRLLTIYAIFHLFYKNKDMKL